MTKKQWRKWKRLFSTKAEFNSIPKALSQIEIVKTTRSYICSYSEKLYAKRLSARVSSAIDYESVNFEDFV